MLTLAADLALAQIRLPTVAGLFIVLVVAEIAVRLLPRGDEPSGPTGVTWPWWDLPARALSTVVLVVAVTTAAGVAGPSLTGVLAPFPVATSVVAAFTLATRGPAATIETLRGALRGLRGFAGFCFLVAVLVEDAGVGHAFLAATIGALAIQLLTPRRTKAVTPRRTKAVTPRRTKAAVRPGEAVGS